MDEKELAVRLYKAWYGIEEFNGEAAKLKPHWLRVAAEATRIAKEARVEALREAMKAAEQVSDTHYGAYRAGHKADNHLSSMSDGADDVASALQATVEAEV